VVEIFYKNKKIEKQLTEPREMVKAFGHLARKVNQRLEDLKAADTLAVMRLIPAARCHELKGNRKSELAIDISGNSRMIFEPYHDPIPRKDDGGIKWEEITKIQINEIVDYH
jgi:proteic killer suppression protein